MGHKAAETTPNNNTFGPGTANERTVQSWVKKFAKETRALKIRKAAQRPASGSWQRPVESNRRS